MSAGRQRLIVPYPNESRCLALSDGEIEAVSRRDAVLEVEVRTWRDERVIVRFVGVVAVIDRAPGSIGDLVELDPSDSRAVTMAREELGDRRAVRAFAFTEPWDDAPVLEIACDAAAFEVTALEGAPTR